MSMILHILLILPIHKRSEEDYYAQHDKYVNEKKAEIESQFNRPFNTLSQELQLNYEDHWWWPLWIFNDIIGFLKIGLDFGSCLVGEIYLRRKYFPRELKRYHLKYHSTLQRHEFLHYLEIAKRGITFFNNETYVNAAREIIKDAKIMISKRYKTAKIWLPGYDINCIDLAKAHQQMIKSD